MSLPSTLLHGWIHWLLLHHDSTLHYGDKTSLSFICIYLYTNLIQEFLLSL